MEECMCLLSKYVSVYYLSMNLLIVELCISLLLKYLSLYYRSMHLIIIEVCIFLCISLLTNICSLLMYFAFARDLIIRWQFFKSIFSKIFLSFLVRFICYLTTSAIYNYIHTLYLIWQFCVIKKNNPTLFFISAYLNVFSLNYYTINLTQPLFKH